MKKVNINHYQDNGRECVSVSLKNSDQLVRLYQDDFNRLVENGVDIRWKIKGKEIVTQGTKPISITRLVAEAPKGTWVKLADNDHFNLLRSNILLGRIKDKTKPTDLIHTYVNPFYMRELLERNTK